MKYIIPFFATIILGFLFHLLLPFWAIVLASLLVGFFLCRTAGLSFIVTFLGAFTLWLGMTVNISIQNEFILVERMGDLLGEVSPYLLITGIGIIGGLLAGIGGLSGWALKKTFYYG